MTYNTNNKRNFSQLTHVWNEGDINVEEINKQADEWWLLE
jgi:hypothetical protein